MKQAITSTEYLAAMKGFKHGVHGWDMDPIYKTSNSYKQGYLDGALARSKYSQKLCEHLGLQIPSDPYAVQTKPATASVL